MKRFLKREIKLVSTEDLNVRYCRILERAELLDAEEIPVADAREILWIEDETHERLIKAVGHDFYPPDCIEERCPSNYMMSLLKPKPQPEPEPAPLLNFKITITSSIGTEVKKWDVKVSSRSEADLIAQNEITRRKLKKATYRIN